jgi:hypothetical protein
MSRFGAVIFSRHRETRSRTHEMPEAPPAAPRARLPPGMMRADGPFSGYGQLVDLENGSIGPTGPVEDSAPRRAVESKPRPKRRKPTKRKA